MQSTGDELKLRRVSGRQLCLSKSTLPESVPKRLAYSPVSPQSILKLHDDDDAEKVLLTV